MGSRFLQRVFRSFDWPLMLYAVLLCLIGGVSIYSATYLKGAAIIVRQSIWFALGMGVFVTVIMIGYRRVLESIYPLYAIFVFALLIVLLAADPRFGARRWLSFGNISFQPSEMMKLIMILMLARYFAHRRTFELPITEVLMVLGLIAVPVFLILEEPDLGTAFVFIPITLAIFYLWGVRIKYFLGLLSVGILSLPLFWFVLKDYQKERLLVFIDPNIDPLGAGYTVIQSKIAIGSGGWWGKGLVSGTQNLLNFLPEGHTDFIFSVIGEEWGFCGVFALIMLYILLLERILKVAAMTRDSAARLCCGGIFTMIAFQVMTNLGMTMGFMPVVGLPLPFVSYGGSQMIVMMMALGIVESIAIEQRLRG